MKYPTQNIKQKAIELGLELKVTRPTDNVDKLKEYIANNYHATMDWLADKPEVRGNLKNMWPEGVSVLAFSMNYHNLKNPLERLNHADKGYISCYSLNQDYHDVFKKRLKEFARWLVSEHPGSELKVFVDTAPVMERPLAEAAGLGWRGKHGCILNRTYGGWIFLGVIYTTLEFEEDEPTSNHCGSCTKCLDVCPTDAFVGEQTIDSNKCVSYLTIEHKGMIEEELMEKMGNRIYGCDDCIGICPWNKFAQVTQEIKFQAREELISPDLEYLVSLNDEEFRKLFTKSPIKRIKLDRFIRNVVIAIGNSGNQKYIKTLEHLIATETDETVINTSKWALKKLKNSKITVEIA
tara:strand:- start:107 stop:1156 length:1050 start_codon:yes stop_codon:yes gene_type:complete